MEASFRVQLVKIRLFFLNSKTRYDTTMFTNTNSAAAFIPQYETPSEFYNFCGQLQLLHEERTESLTLRLHVYKSVCVGEYLWQARTGRTVVENVTKRRRERVV